MHLPVAVHRHPRARRALRALVLRQRLSERVLDRTRGTILATDCRVARSFFTRGLGLIPRSSLRMGEGLRITKTSAITMFFMRFAIDAVFVDRAGRVVKTASRLRPWTPLVAARGADAVIELPAGAVERAGTQVGDEILFERA